MLKDQRDLLLAFNTHNVRYLVIGCYAYSYYTEPRGSYCSVHTELSLNTSATALRSRAALPS
jgi:hypothetical protein